ncbi:hypothetical protein [Desulfotignum balticum]|uniref:hypothetical protein n=1 Tax=Desulfotignum balticum TaxID=115781 RepID=UPI000462CB93|nr:hypothetical protein [Desulfotignum balticum]
MFLFLRTITLVFVLFFSFVFSSDVRAQPFAVYSGTGDDVQTISKPDKNMPALLAISGNSAGRHFAVIARDGSGNRVRALVNTTDAYAGIVPIDLPPRTDTTLLEIKASGGWRIKVYSIGAAQRAKVPGVFNGEGDNLIVLKGNPKLANVRGNSASRHFAVIAYDKGGNRLGAKVNTTDPYNGTIILPSRTLLLEIKAVGGWTVDLQ